MDFIFDIFNNDVFFMMMLIMVMWDIKYILSFVFLLGFFQEINIFIFDIVIEIDKQGNVFIVFFSLCGGFGKIFGCNCCSMWKFSVFYFQVDDVIMVDEVQVVCVFGDVYVVEIFQGKIVDCVVEILQNIFVLIEEYYCFIVFMKGQFFDVDGFVFYDYQVEMGQSMLSLIDFDFDVVMLVVGVFCQKCIDIYCIMVEQFDGIFFWGVMVLCGNGVFDVINGFKEVWEIYFGYNVVVMLCIVFVNIGQDGMFGMFDYGDICWINYCFGQNVGIEDDECYFVLIGMFGFFKMVYVLVDYIDIVNCFGQCFYVYQWIMFNKKGVNLEYQFNVFYYCICFKVFLKGILI